MNETYVIGIDIGGTNFRIGAVYPNNKVREFRKVSVENVFRTEYPLKDLTEYIEDYMRSPELVGEAESVAIGFPATVSRDKMTVVQAPNVKYMENLPVVTFLQDKLQLPVYIEKDVCMTVHYDMDKLQIPEKGVLCGIYFGTGIGNVVCVDGELFSGKNGAAGELGHLPVPGCNEVCGCGNIGCMESIAGGKYLAKLCRKKYPDIYIGDIFKKCSGEKEIMEFVDRMAMAVAAEVNILDPDYVIVGGGVPNMVGFPVAFLDRKIHEHTRKPYPEKELNIIYVSDDEMKSVTGAGLYARKKEEFKR